MKIQSRRAMAPLLHPGHFLGRLCGVSRFSHTSSKRLPILQVCRLPNYYQHVGGVWLLLEGRLQLHLLEAECPKEDESFGSLLDATHQRELCENAKVGQVAL